MFLTLRRFIVILLTLVQCIAPLVHAHASKYGDNKQGFHVPGLERFDSETKPHSVLIDKAQDHASSEGWIVAVDLGHKQNPTNHPVDSDNDLFLHQQAIAFDPAVSKLNTSFSSLLQQLVDSSFSPYPPSRAPPER